MMGQFGTLGINGIVVSSQNSGSGGSFTATYNIPSALVGSYRIAIRLQSPTSGFFAYNWFFNNTSGTTGTTATPVSGYTGFPTFSILSVVRDKTVIILTNNMPPKDTFTVTMGPMGTKGINGTVVGSTYSGNGGVFTETYTIPANLAGSTKIAIRLQSPTSGYFAYNWFWNNTTGSTTPVPTPNPGPTPTPGPVFHIPTFSITGVVRDKTVTILTNNFPANDSFTVTMGPYGTKGVGGIVVGTQASGNGGSFTATYNVPASLAGSSRIAIRLQSPTSGFFAYNWFWNNTTTDP
jgi:hypothetical protein